ncbi:complement C1q subcomponent subunit B-like isoform X2 [Mizuhopecten yessoensis]|uniref:complement C1q subcomponent subunit B-like isoform X2 n=1 Tax=Mizuhopecten yessoensis TaxID=6573 RepID=UPI000B45DE2D|nr:complement C1q subcomponent subunit B-like isoform X2 [Mizuhopecten yessoensis]
MEYGVVLVMLLAVAFAINSHEDHKYDNLLNEVSALKTFVFNMNVELDKVRKKYDDVHEELRAVRSEQQVMDTYPITPKPDAYNNYPKRNEDNGGTIQQNTRAAANMPTFHLSSVWNGSKAFGPKGEKVDSGPQGLQGVKGTIGPPGSKGENGHKGGNGKIGIAGPKGDIGTTGSKGQNGANGRPGTTGPKGPKGNTDFDEPGGKGSQGYMGLIGQKGEPGQTVAGTNTMVVFSAMVITPILNIKKYAVIEFKDQKLNIGGFYNPVNGIFRCGVPGVYMFSWSIVANAGYDLITSLDVNGVSTGNVIVDNPAQNVSSGSNTVVLDLNRGDVVAVKVWETSTGAGLLIGRGSSFSGYLLH